MILLVFMLLQGNPGINEVDLPDLNVPAVTVNKEQVSDFYALLGMKLIKLYQQSFSQVQGDVCNFIPSCSHFGYEALHQFGIIKGLLLTSDRLQRCHPMAWKYLDFYGLAVDSTRGERLYDPPARYK